MVDVKIHNCNSKTAIRMLRSLHSSNGITVQITNGTIHISGSEQELNEVLAAIQRVESLSTTEEIINVATIIRVHLQEQLSSLEE